MDDLDKPEIGLRRAVIELTAGLAAFIALTWAMFAGDDNLPSAVAVPGGIGAAVLVVFGFVEIARLRSRRRG